MSLNLIKAANEIQSKLPTPEYALGKGLMQPANNTNSGPRKIMQGLQREQSIQITRCEAPILMTGYENQFGELSSSFIRAKSEYMVIDKIYKNKMMYWMIVKDLKTNMLHVFERNTYEYITEMYGYNLYTEYIDSLQNSAIIPKGTPIIKPRSFDMSMNMCGGVNLTTAYLAMGETTEDPIILSESAAKKLEAPMFHSIQLVVNDNDILLNLYGDDNNYKSFPDIGEYTKNNILCAIRKERKDDEALYCQSVQRLKELMVSDASYIASGMVIDIDVYLNNPESTNPQIAKYYEKKLGYCKKIIETVEKNIGSGAVSYDLAKLYDTSKRVLNGDMYIKDKVFTNAIIDIMLQENKPMDVGDKSTDRYAGKGVVSFIRPDDEMPMIMRNGELRPIEVIYNSSTIVNRENPGQSFETEIIFVGEKIVEKIINSHMSASKNHRDMEEVLAESENLVIRYLNIVAPLEAVEYMDFIKTHQIEDRKLYMDSIMGSEEIYVVAKPISGGLNIETLFKLYNEFPWIEADDMYVRQQNSDGTYRRTNSRRKIVVGKKYVYRLKQTSEEKFSAVSLASTNLRGENTKTKANKQHRIAYANTPVRMGDMEITNLLDAKDLNLRMIITFMLLSSSFKYRRQVHQLIIGDPFKPVIELDANSNALAVSRSAEITKVLLKTIGLSLDFQKRKKVHKTPIRIDVLQEVPNMNEVHPKSVIMPIPYYLGYKDLERLCNIYMSTYKKECEDATRDYSGSLDIKAHYASSKVLEIAYKCENLRELEEKVRNKPKKMMNVVFVSPIVHMIGSGEIDREKETTRDSKSV